MRGDTTTVENVVRDVCYDTEFLDDGERIRLISIGMVDDQGHAYYAVNHDAPWGRVRQERWLVENVWPHLPLVGYSPGPDGVDLGDIDTNNARVKPHWVIANEVRDFLLGPPGVAPAADLRLFAYSSAYDQVALAQLWGPMSQLPPGIPMFTHDLRAIAEDAGFTDDRLPPHGDDEHGALADARWNQRLLACLRDRGLY